MLDCTGTMSAREKEKEDSLQKRHRDRISELPDHILHVILAPLEMEQAARTSILSRRWRYLWTDRKDLDFEPFYVLPECDPELLRCDQDEIVQYMDWIDRVVKLHTGPSIDKFRIWFFFAKTDYRSRMDRWIKFALSKRVKELEIDLMRGHDGLRYSLGSDILNDFPITSITSLILVRVGVSGESLELIMSQCRHLERLSVVDCRDLVTFKVKESVSHKLKHLKINCCPLLKELEVHAPNLLSFDYDGANVVFGRATSLVEATFGGRSCSKSFPIFKQMKAIFSQLSKITFHLCWVGYDIPFEILPSFGSVKYLELIVTACMHESFLPAIRFIKACPVLHNFKLKVFWMDNIVVPPEAMELQEEDFGLYVEDVCEGESNKDENLTEENLEILEGDMHRDIDHQWTHPMLKELEFDMFFGYHADVDLIMNIIDIAINLETIVCSCSQWHVDLELEDASRSRANKLARILSPKVVVLTKF